MPGNRLWLDAPSPSSVAVGQTAKIKIPLGNTIHGVALLPTNLTLAEIEDIRVVVNGKVITRYDSGTQLDVLNQADGIPSAGAGDISFLYIPFDRKGLRTRDAEEITAIGTGAAEDPNPVQTLEVEVDIAAGAAGVTLAAQYEASGPSNSGLVKTIRLFPSYTAGGAGEFEISDLPRTGIITKIYATGANITNLEIKRDQFTIFDRSLTTNNAKLALDGYRAAPASGFLFDAGEAGFGSNGIVLNNNVQDFRLIYDMSAGETFSVLVEYLAPISR